MALLQIKKEKKKRITQLEQLNIDNFGKSPNNSTRRREAIEKSNSKELDKKKIILEDLLYPGDVIFNKKVIKKERSKSSSIEKSEKFDSARSSERSNSTGRDADTFNLPDIISSKTFTDAEISSELKLAEYDF